MQEQNGSIGLQYQPIYDLSGGMVTNQNFATYRKNQQLRILNGDLSFDGSIQKRKGRRKLNATAISGNPAVTSLSQLGQIGAADLILAGTGANLYEVSTGTPALVKGSLTADKYLAFTPLDNYMFYCNGFDKPFMTQGSSATTYDVGIPEVTAAQYAGMTVATSTAAIGPLVGLSAGVHRFAYRYRSTITGARSNPYIVSATVNGTVEPVINGSTTVSASDGDSLNITIGAAAVNSDAQVDLIDIFMQTADALIDAPYYYICTVNNAAAGPFNFPNSTYPDISDDANIIREILDVDDDQPPVTLRNLESYKGRLLGIVDDYHVQYTKQRSDLNGFANLPTSWPALNSLEVGYGDGDPLVKVVRFFDYIFAFKKRSIWWLAGDFDTPGFGFRRLKTNYTNIGLLNQKCVAQAGDKCFFLTDSLHFQYFSITDFNTEQVRVQTPVPSDRIADLFASFLPGFRDQANLVNFSFGSYTQIWTAFANGDSQMNASSNFNVFVFDHTLGPENGDGNPEGSWSLQTGVEVAASVLAKDNDGNYNVYTGDYYGFVWQNGVTDGDGAFINSTSTGSNTVSTFNDTTQTFDDTLLGTFISILSGPGMGQVRRVTSINSDTQIGITPDWTTLDVPDSTSTYTIGGIDFQVWTRFDWCDEEAPPDFDKEGWYLDLDIETNFGTVPTTAPFLAAPNYGVEVSLVINRGSEVNTEVTRSLVVSGATWGTGVWGFDTWGASNKLATQVGFDLFYRTISARIVNSYAGQFVKINGWSWCYQNLQHVRVT